MSLEDQFTKEKLEEFNKNLNKKVHEAIINYGVQKREEELEYKMSKEREAGLYCLGCSSTKLVALLKALCWSELEVITTDKLDAFYRSTLANIKIILNLNEHIKKLKECNELINLVNLLPDILTNSSLRITDWESVMQTAFKIDSKISKICYVDSYTTPNDDPYTAELIEMSNYIPEHWEMRSSRTPKEIVDKVNKTNTLKMTINSNLIKKEKINDEIMIKENSLKESYTSDLNNKQNIYEYMGLKIDISEAVLIFKNEPSVSVNCINKQEFKFLILCLKKNGEIATWNDMREVLYPGQNITNYPDNVIQETAKGLKQALYKTLISLGINEESSMAIKNMVTSVRGVGYKMTPPKS